MKYIALLVVLVSKMYSTDVALFGEVCGNLEALHAVIGDIRNRKIEEVVCLGGIVGYGANPNECIDEIRKMNIVTIKGQMEDVLTKSVEAFNPYAKASIEWTKGVITKSNLEWAQALPISTTIHGAGIYNSTVHQPEMFNYIMTVADAQLSFDKMKEGSINLAFLAHSNVPVAFFGTNPITYSLDRSIPLDGNPTIINVGSVGQPRDENNMACYQIWNLESKTITQMRIKYDIKLAQEKIRKAGLPEILAARLEQGK